ncbi:MAG: MG2 domain-containing protein, partial [Pirellulales bacterium]
MKSARVALIIGFVITLFSFSTDKGTSEDSAAGRSLQDLQQTMKEGNFLDAYEGFHRLAVEPRTNPHQVPNALADGVECLKRLSRTSDIGAVREGVIRVHAGNPRLLWRAARTYLAVDHHGFLIAGRFHRGPHRGGGEPVHAVARDRIRALQLMQQAMAAVDEQLSSREASDFYLALADMLLSGRGSREAWRLQALSDLSELPDYEPGRYWSRGQTRGAPVDGDGRPIFHTLPTRWKVAQSDGQRWRFALARAVERDPRRRNTVRYRRATFLQQQFGVQTLADYGPLLARAADVRQADGQTSGTYALHTLSDEETIAKLAIGVRRLTLPDEFNPIKIYRKIVADDATETGARASQQLARIFENRRQYHRAADAWRESIERYGDTEAKRKHLDQIEGNWGRFETLMTEPAGEGATVDFRFRNGRQVALTAHRIRVAQLIGDLKAYLKSGPKKLNWNQMQLENLGHRLVTRNEQKYVGKEVARWQLDLQPRANHWDRRVTVATPLQEAGAYLLTATMADGNTSKIILWVSDTAIVKKPMAGKSFYYVSDAVSGQPIAGATLELFGYRQQRLGKNRFQIETRQHAEQTDGQGQVQWEFEGKESDYQWLTIATTPDGRLAFLGFSGVWRANYTVPTYDQTKVFCITDRPVYRPDQPVHFKLWVRHARYDGAPASEFAHQAFQVVIHDPKGNKIDTRQLVADEYGGIEGEYPLPADATLGLYRVMIERRGGGTFSVEEYKKPEFEVTVEAPDKPVLLGEKVTATVRARYYFGAPVTEASVKVKVVRTAHDATWYPPAPWDWLYGPGYWWFADNYTWYPTWRQWGCLRPSPIWWWRPQLPPEVVAELETEIGPDGTVRVDIDTALAKALHGDQDHRYQIVAEVVDRSRRTIVGEGEILVGRKPVHVVAWTDRGYYRVGDVIHASVAARTLDQKPLAGKGRAELFRITYDHDRSPVETSVGTWDVDTDSRGKGRLRIQASRQGQYRIAYHWTDAKGHAFDAGYLLTIVGDRFDGAEFQFSDLELVPDRREYAPGETVRLQINTNRVGTTVLLFIRPSEGVYLPPKVVSLKGKSTIVDIGVERRDMPNFFVEAVTVSRGRVFTVTREICVPPQRRMLGVEVVSSSTIYRPGEKAEIQLKLTDEKGAPFVGSTVVTIYDKAVETIAGGSNVPGIKEFFWKWRRRHRAATTTNLGRYSGNLTLPRKLVMANIGLFGASVADELGSKDRGGTGGETRFGTHLKMRAAGAMVEKSMAPQAAPMRAAVPSEEGVAAGAVADAQETSA